MYKNIKNKLRHLIECGYACRFCGFYFETEAEGAAHSWTVHGEQ